MHLRFPLLFLSLSSAALATVNPIDLGPRLELLVDRFLVDRLQGVTLKLAEPRPAGVALRFDQPWEQIPTGTMTILEDEGRFRLYYSALPRDYTSEPRDTNLCYAESVDGITWTKPVLRLAEFRGSRENNLLMTEDPEERYAGNFTPFIDRRPGVPPEERYKAVGGVWPKGMFVLVSADGIRWKKWRPQPVFTAGAFDSQNVAFWSEAEQCYVLFFRVFTGTDHTAIKTWQMDGSRSIAKTTSADLVNWTAPQRMSFGDTPLEQLYENKTHPYPRAPHLYVSYPMRFVPGRRVLSDETFVRLGVLPSYVNHVGIPSGLRTIPYEVSDTVFMTSRGGYRYDRTFMEAFLRPGTDEGNWVSRNGIAAVGTVVTGPAEMSVYVGQHYMQPSGHLGRFTLRLDGFASWHAPYAGGEVVTKPIKVSGNSLIVNGATSAAGSVRVEVQTEDGEPIPGYTLSESAEMVFDSIEYPVRWAARTGLEALAGKTVRLRFVMKDADLYALRFR